MRNQKCLRGCLRNSHSRTLLSATALCVALLASAATLMAQQTNRPPANRSLVRPKTVATVPAANFKSALPLPSSTPVRTSDSYRIGPGDVLEVRIYKLPDLSRAALRVEETGTIRMPLIKEDIQAACRTESELANDIANKYLPLMRNPQVDVFIKEYNSRPVAVIGAVNTPGRFQLQRRIRLLELLSFAGGPTERAGGNIQVVHSPTYVACSEAGPSINKAPSSALDLNTFKLRDTLAGNARSNPYVQPGDVITLLEFEQIYVVGNVVKPSSFPLKERITLSQAVAMAGGLLPDSQSDRVRLIRQKADGMTKEEVVVDLKAITRRRAQDIVLQPNDIVEVPTAGGRRFLRNVLEGVVGGATRFPVRVIP